MNRNWPGGELAMKMTLLTLFTFCFLSSGAALAQLSGGYISSEARPVHVPSHEQHAYEGTLRPQQNLYVRTASSIGQGERPLWEFAQPSKEMPLGDVARLFREQHATVKKAVRVLEK